MGKKNFMQKTLAMLLLAMAITITGCGKKEEAVAPTDDTLDNVPVVEETPMEENLRLMEWFQQGEPVKCSVNSPTGMVDTWVSGNKVRIEGIGFDPSKPGEVGSMIADGEWIYTWTGTTGMKFSAAAAGEVPQGAAGSSTPADWQETVSAWDSAGVDYQCEKTAVDENFFVAPSEVVFSDLGALLEVASTTTETLMNELPGDMRRELEREMGGRIPGGAEEIPADPALDDMPAGQVTE